MAERVKQPHEIKVGQFYESCNFHPCLCSDVDEAGVQIQGISLVNGDILYCNILHCGLRLLTANEAISWKIYGPTDYKDIGEDKRWW